MRNKWLFTLALTLPLVSCGDFFNSKEAAPRQTGEAQQPARPQKNPFPPGFENPNSGPFSEEKMLVNIGVNVLAKNARTFSLHAELLADEISGYCAALEQQSDVMAKERSAKEQWRKTMLAYHQVDAVPLGPLSDMGRYLQDHIYAWPFLDRCGIDREVIQFRETGALSPQLLHTIKGLGGLEYLLFEPELKSSCHPVAHPKTVEWSNQPAGAKKLQRCRLAIAFGQDLKGKAELLDQHWDPNEGNFSKTLIDGSRFVPVKEATNALSDALFELERMKDQRIGRPLGLHKECVKSDGKESCPEAAEHQWSGLALEAMVARLKGFQGAFFGGANPAFGLDDFLTSRGHGAVAEQIRLKLNRAIQSGDELSAEGSFQEQISRMSPALCAGSSVTDRKEPLCAFFQDVRAVTTILKIEFLSVLQLRSPPMFEADND